MSYANMDGVPTQTAGTSEILASDWNTYVRDNFDSIKFGHIVCESTSRPTGIAEGTMIYETDTNQVLVYNGSSWFAVHDLDNNAGLPTTITTANIGDSQVTSAKIADGTIATADIGNAQITHAKFDSSLGIPLRTQSARGYYSNGATISFASGRFTGTNVGVVVTPNTIGSALTFCITTVPSTASFGIEFNNAAAGWLSWYAFSY